MAYKIVKYKGKTQIKDTKSGKSTEIDIEKFMNGGYKDINKYALGGENTCPPGQKPDGKGGCMPSFGGYFDTQEYKDIMTPVTEEKQKYANLANQVNDSVNPNTKMPLNKKQGVFTDEESDEIELAGQNQGFMNQRQDLAADNLYDPIKAAGREANFDLDESMRNLDVNSEVNNNQNYNMPNPYGGVDIPSAANYLGQSIKNGDALGGTIAGVKVAAGLGRNIMSGMGQANREQYTMTEAFKNLKKDRNVPQYMQNGGMMDYLANGGKKDEEMITSEYMSGVENEKIEKYNAEIEDGEYLQTNQGDIAEVVGNKHSQGGEKVNMEAEDRVLSDKLKLGAQQAKSLASKYDLKLKAKNTYSDVLDKFRKKTKLDKLVEEEASMMKKIGDQQKVEDATTRDFNIQVLSEKVKEIQQQKEPIEEARKGIFDELFNIQEDSKPKDKQTNNSFEDGGKLSSLAEEYGISIDRAKELIQNFKYGGKKEVPKYETGEAECPEGYQKNDKGECVKLTKEEAKALAKVRPGQSVNTETGSFGKVTPESYKASLDRNNWYFKNNPDFDKSDPKQVKDYQSEYNKIAERLGGPTVQVDGKWGEQTDSIDVSRLYESAPTNEENIKMKNERDNGMGMYLFPDEQPLPPSSLQGTIKPTARYDRVSANEISVDPYLQDIRNSEQSQVQSLEGLSPNVRAAVLANMRGNSQNQESKIRNQVDTQNLQAEDRAMYTNAQIQQREQNQNNNYNQGYENRIYTAQANQERDLNDYYTQLQSINKQKFMDVQNLNLINASNEDVAYVPGRGYIRKQGSSNQDFSNRIAKQYSTNQ
jgi:hypothetical protein